jgi:hypothetical protein
VEQDPFYDTEEYRADGGDGTQHWFYKVRSHTTALIVTGVE